MAAAHSSLPHAGAALPPLTGSDGDAFTRASVLSRLPSILDATAAANPSWPAAAAARVAELAGVLRADGPARWPLLPGGDVPDGAPDAPFWAAGAQPVDASSRVTTVPWFWLENATYACLRGLLARAGAAGDPFASQKLDALASAGAAWAARLDADAATAATSPPVPAAATAAATAAAAAAIERALLTSLWGNRADMSLHVHAGAAAAAAAAGDSSRAAVLVDDAPAGAAAAAAAAGRGALIVVLLDNAGAELLADLELADALLSAGARVTLWAKAAPVFVSDALSADVDAHVRFAAAAGGAASALARRLADAATRGRFAVVEEPFLTSPLAWWDAPPSVRAAAAAAALVIVKGDANYRRLLGDRHWPHATPFSAAVAGFPAPLLALRTAKSGIVVGLPPEAEARAAAAAPDWCVSGAFGLVQFAGGGGAAAAAP